MVHLGDGSPSISKRYTLNVFRETLPDTWKVEINNRDRIVDLVLGEVVDVPVVLTQTEPEPVGSKHTLKIAAANQITLRNEQRPCDYPIEPIPMGIARGGCGAGRPVRATKAEWPLSVPSGDLHRAARE